MLYTIEAHFPNGQHHMSQCPGENYVYLSCIGNNLSLFLSTILCVGHERDILVWWLTRFELLTPIEHQHVSFWLCSFKHLKLPSLFAARFFWTFQNKLRNMKALVILSHHDHHFSHLLVFMKKKELLWAPVSSFFVRKNSPQLTVST